MSAMTCDLGDSAASACVPQPRPHPEARLRGEGVSAGKKEETNPSLRRRLARSVAERKNLPRPPR